VIYDNVVLTTYLTANSDPQRGFQHLPDDIEKIAFYHDVHKLKLKTIVFHDELSAGFIAKWGSEYVEFVRKTVPTFASNNDYRFLLFEEFLNQHEVTGNVWISDAFDVRINRDPNTMVTDEAMLWVGRDAAKWPLRDIIRMIRLFGKSPTRCHGSPLPMPGSWGGPTKHVRHLLHQLTHEIAKLHRPRANLNRFAFMLVLYRDFGLENIWIEGAPFNSKFKKYETTADCCFIHK